MPISAGTLTNPKAMTLPAITVTTARMASWIHTVRWRRTMSIRSPPVRRDERIARRVRAGLLPDRAAPLQFQFSQLTLESGSCEQARVQSAQSQVDDKGD